MCNSADPGLAAVLAYVPSYSAEHQKYRNLPELHMGLKRGISMSCSSFHSAKLSQDVRQPRVHYSRRYLLERLWIISLGGH